MCGRFVLLTDLSVILELFDIQEVSCDYQPGRNISPGQEIAVVIHEGKNRLDCYRWGLIPSSCKDPSIGNRLINARAETIAEKSSFRSAFKKRRCLIPADGYYEWQRIGKVKKPYLFSLKSGEPFGFAGLHETWISPENKAIHTCTIITTEPNDLVRPFHDRMPVILPKEREAAWTDPDYQNLKELKCMLQPYPSDEMVTSDVDPSLLHRPKTQEPAYFQSLLFTEKDHVLS